MTLTNELYGTRKQPKLLREISSSNTLSFTSTLAPLISSAQETKSGRPRLSRTKPNLFTTYKKSSNKREAQEISGGKRDSSSSLTKKIRNHEIKGVDDATLHRSRRKMEAKAKIYSQMKYGEVPEHEETLVDFDQKWTEHEETDSDTHAQNESDDNNGDMVEYEDEFGRARQATRTEIEKMERKKKIAFQSAEELKSMSVRPEMPSQVIHGDTIQSMAFDPDELVKAKMEELAAKRDRSLTPPEMRHYEADKEVRTKGVGFYSFSKDEALREEEMKSLEKERLETENRRKEKEEKKKERLVYIEERRKEIQERRAKKQADTFLDSLDVELDT